MDPRAQADSGPFPKGDARRDDASGSSSISAVSLSSPILWLIRPMVTALHHALSVTIHCPRLLLEKFLGNDAGWGSRFQETSPFGNTGRTTFSTQASCCRSMSNLVAFGPFIFVSSLGGRGKFCEHEFTNLLWKVVRTENKFPTNRNVGFCLFFYSCPTFRQMGKIDDRRFIRRIH